MEHRNQKTPRARTLFALRISLRGVFSDCLFAFCFGGLTLLSAGRRVVCRGRTDFPFFLPSINSCRALFGRAVRACRQRTCRQRSAARWRMVSVRAIRRRAAWSSGRVASRPPRQHLPEWYLLKRQNPGWSKSMRPGFACGCCADCLVPGRLLRSRAGYVSGNTFSSGFVLPKRYYFRE